MQKVELRQFGGPGEVAESAAEIWVASNAKSVVLSGGRITTAFLQKAALKFGKPPDCHLFWADERCVSPESPDSNYLQAFENFIRPLKFPENRVHRIRGELPPKEAARLASQEIEGFKPLDIVFLGMGEDGHVASLFPNAGREVEQATNPYTSVTGPKPPSNRVTLSYQMITSAKQVCCLVSGAGKENALKRCLEFDHLPLGIVLKHRPQTIILTDVKV